MTRKLFEGRQRWRNRIEKNEVKVDRDMRGSFIEVQTAMGKF
jgi:hypothetical protein